MATLDLRQSTIFSRLRGLLEVTRLVRTGEELPGPPLGDRAHRLRLARVPHGRRQPLPPRVGRLRRHHRLRQRRSARGAARPGAAGGRLGAAPRPALPAARRVPRPVRRVRLGRVLRQRLHAGPPGQRRPERVASRRRALRADARQPTGGCSGSSPSTSRSRAASRAATRSTCSSPSPSTRRSPSQAAQEAARAKANRDALERLLAVSTRLNETLRHRRAARAACAARSRRRSASTRSPCSC